MKVLVIGAELPRPDSAHFEAASLRTRQIVIPLISAGCSVRLVSWLTNNMAKENSSNSDIGLEASFLDFRNGRWIYQINSIDSGFKPDCIVGISYRGAAYATRIRERKPIWMDLYGDVLAEGQVLQHAKGTNRGALSAVWLDRMLLKIGDIFSTCSERQRYAVIGKLGLMGRLKRETLGYEFVHNIPPGILENDSRTVIKSPNSVFVVKSEEGKLATIPKKAIVVLWSGSYNCWMDETTLFNGLIGAMAHDDRLLYISTGKGVKYARFTNMVKESPFRNRFHLLGWQPYSVVQELLYRANIGLIVDALHYEVLLGTRTRLIEMASAGLAILCTRGCELVESLENEEAIRAFNIGDSAVLSTAILDLGRNPELRQKLAKRAIMVIKEKYSYENTAQPLVKWVNSPSYAPDKNVKSFRLQLENNIRLYVRKTLWRVFGLLK